MNEHDPALYGKAFTAFTQWMEHAELVRSLFEQIDEPLPKPLRMYLGLVPEGKNDSLPSMVIPPPKSPPRPPEAKSDWIWIDKKRLLPTTLALACLRVATSPMSPKQVWECVKEVIPDLVPGTIYNIGPRLEGKTIVRSDDGWSLVSPELAPILLGDHAWGPVGVFQKSEVAEHRREIILHILRMQSDGLMNMQIVRQLEDSKLCKGPVSKDLVKADIESLAKEDRIRRIGRTKKWTIADKK